MKRSLIGPALLFALVLLAGDAAVVWYFQGLRDLNRSTEAERVRGLVTAAMLRHIEAVRHLGRPMEGGAEAERARADSVAQVFPALVGVARLDAQRKTVFAADLKGFEAGAARISNDSMACKLALAGSAAVDDPFPAPNGETVVEIWTPTDAGAVAGILRLDRLIGDAVNSSAGEESSYELTDSRGRKPASRGNIAEATLPVNVSLPGLTWILRVHDSVEEHQRTQALIWSIVALSTVLWAGFVMARRRSIVDRMRLEQRAGEIERMAGEVEALAGADLRERGKMLTLIDSLEEGVVLAGPNGETLMCNASGERMLGPEPKLLRRDGSAPPKEDLPVHQAIAKGVKISTDELFADRDGARIPLSIVAAPLFDEDRKVTGAFAVHRDISKQREWEETVSNRDFALTIKNKLGAEMADAKDEEEVMRRLNYHLEAALQPQSTNIFLKRPGSDRLRAERTTGLKPEPGFEPPVLSNPAMCPVLESGEPMDPRTCAERVQPCLGRISPGGFLCAPLRVGGKVEGMIHVELQSENPEPSRVELVLDLIAAASGAISSKRYLAIISQAAIRDPLTSLYNRRHFDEVARVMVVGAKRSHRPLGVLMIDIDHFKVFNDTHGHDAGDVVLRRFSAALQATARQSDVMVRYGGEEFAVLLPDTGLAQARIAADRILEAARKVTLPIKGYENGQITVSIGVSAFPEHGDTPESLVKAADKALYVAKFAGRNCTRVSVNTIAPAVAPPGPAKL